MTEASPAAAEDLELLKLERDLRIELDRAETGDSLSLPSPPHAADTSVSSRLAAEDEELTDEEEDAMQRSSSRSTMSFAGQAGGFSLFTGKNGHIDRQKTGLVLLCFVLSLWIFYDLCSDWHHASYNNAVLNLERGMHSAAGDAEAIGGVLRAPGSADGSLPTSTMFRNLPTASMSFLNEAGVLAFPLQPEHIISKQINGMHVGTILPGATRGNHMHNKHSEVLVLVHGHFLLRVAMLGNDGEWVSEDHIFEIGLPGNPFSSSASTISSSPIGLEVPPHVCHALRNLDPYSVGFFTSYYALGMDEQREEPDRQICRNQPKAFLKPDA